MSLASEIIARRFGLPRAQTTDLLCERDLRATMDDGAVLLADRWVARASSAGPQPTVLVRSPYGRRQLVGLMFGRLLAERGLQVIVQSVRGTFGSEGVFSPFEERADGLATLRWIRAQQWHAQRIGMIGPSYLGLVQWALAPDAGDDLAALAIQVSASQFYGATYAGGSIALESVASWLMLVDAQEGRLAPLAMGRALHRLPALLEQLPMGDFDTRATGAQVPWFREGLASPDRQGAYWARRDYASGVGSVRAPVQLIGGWYDILLPWLLEDFATLRAAGHSPQLIVGPWAHTAPGLAAASGREGLAWLRAHLLGDGRMQRSAAVRIYVTGERAGGGWRELSAWPPAGTRERGLRLASGGRLLDAAADGHPDGEERGDPDGEEPGSDRYRYDPADPTPSVGGPVLLAQHPVMDNRELEARADVLTYTTAPLSETLEAIGPVCVELHARASSPYFDLFARVCDVDRRGVSLNVCDALARVTPGAFETAADGSVRVPFALWPTAHRFAAGHRIRLQVSSGAHPRYARNPGTGEDILSASGLRAVDVELLHGPGHPSVLVLPAPPPDET